MAKKWTKETLKLKEDHTWKAKDGYQIFVADRGAVRFNFPEGWIIVPTSDSIHLYDRRPPHDDCRLAVSFLRLKPIDWSGLPLSHLVKAAMHSDERMVLLRGEVQTVPREDLEVAWAEIRFLDPQAHREAASRYCLGRGFNLQSLITFDFWPEDAARLEPVWEEVLRSLELGRYVQDPTQGEILH